MTVVTAATAVPETRTACPKRMVYGPCGGVGGDGGCEVDRQPCPFVDVAAPAWRPGSPGRPGRKLTPAAWDLGAVAARRAIVVAEVPSASLDPDRQRRAAAVLAGGCDAGLTGDAPWARVQLPPTVRAMLLADEGLRAWAGLHCRDRNRVALEAELLGLAAVGAAAVHCVTGDHQSLGDRPDAAGVFDLDSTRLAALAAGGGMLVSVAESPDSPPAGRRPDRLAGKAAAGATWCILNHIAARATVEDFVAAVRDRTAGIDFVASVPVVTSPEALRLVGRYPAVSLPPELAGAIDGGRPRTAALDASLRLATELLAVDGVVGVNLAAPAIPGAADRGAADVAALGRALGGAS